MQRWLLIAGIAALAIAAFLSTTPHTPLIHAQQNDPNTFPPGQWTRPPGLQGKAVLEGGGPGGAGDCDQVYGPSLVWGPGNFPLMGPFNFQMWYSGNCAGNGSGLLNIAISGDAVNWAKYTTTNGENEIMDGRRGYFDRYIYSPSVLREDSGNFTFRILYEGNDGVRSQIGLATTFTGVDFCYTTDDCRNQYAQGQLRPSDPVIPNNLQPWMSQNVGEPSWLKVDGVYKVWFKGSNAEGVSAIGYATSTDGGLTWNVRADPVLTRGGSADSTDVGSPTVVYDGYLYRMWYVGGDSFGTRRILYATSQDGINWNKYGFNGGVVVSMPFDDVLNGQAYDPSVAVDQDGNYHMMFVATDRNNVERLYYAYNPRPLLNPISPGDTLFKGKATPRTTVIIQPADSDAIFGQSTVDDNGNFTVDVRGSLPSGAVGGLSYKAVADQRASNIVQVAGNTPTATAQAGSPTVTPTYTNPKQATNVLILPKGTATATPTPTSISGAWRPSYSLPTNLRGISMVSSSDGWAVGDGGTILRGSQTLWGLQSSGTVNNLRAVSMVTTTFGMAVGDNGTVQKWDGTNWTSASPAGSGSKTFTSVSFANSSSGWLADNSGFVYGWNGSTFGPAQPVAGVSIRDLASVSPGTAFAVTGDGDNRVYGFTGSGWSAVSGAASQGLNSVAVVTGGGWAVGDLGVIVKYDGSTWSQLGQTPTLFKLNAVALLSPSEGWAVGANGTILRLSGGVWSLFPQNSTAADLNSVHIVSASEAYAVGNGVILRFSP